MTDVERVRRDAEVERRRASISSDDKTLSDDRGWRDYMVLESAEHNAHAAALTRAADALEQQPALMARIESLERALAVEREWTHALGEDTRKQQAMLDDIATALGMSKRKGTGRTDKTPLAEMVAERVAREPALMAVVEAAREMVATRHRPDTIDKLSAALRALYGGGK